MSRINFLPYFLSLIIFCQGHERPGTGSLENKTAITAVVSEIRAKSMYHFHLFLSAPGMTTIEIFLG